MKKSVCALFLILMLLINLFAIPVFADEASSGNDPSQQSEEGGQGGAGNGNTPPESGTSPCTHTGAWTNAGEVHIRTCSTCGEQEYSSHSWGSGTVTKAPGCTEKGVKSSVCTASGCGAEKIEDVAAAGHTYGNWAKVDAATHKRSCTVSGCTGSETVAHDWGSGQVTKAATCEAKGQKIYTCSCGDTKIEELPIAAHNYGSWTVDMDNHSRTCSVCEKLDSGKHTWGEGSVVQEATCKDTGKTVYACSACARVKEVTQDKLTTHTYDNVCDQECNVCGEKRETEHTFSKAWSKDASGHWHTCTGCGEKEDFSKHLAGPGATEEKAQTCVTCGLVLTPKLKHSHSYEKKYSSNELGHWYACTGCEEEKDFEEHLVDGVCDSECDSCGYRFKTTHIFGGAWESDETGHWNLCTLCGAKSDQEDHVPFPGTKEDAAKFCSVCSFEIEPAEVHTHLSIDGWQYNDSSHWWDCSCGEKQEESAHSWDEGMAGKNDTITYTCNVCAAERVIEAESSRGGSVVLLIILVVLVIAFVATVIVLIYLLRGGKGSGRFSS